jgi:hypothetical protein
MKSRLTIVRPVSIPPALWAVWQEHREGLPALSAITVEGMEAALRAKGIDPPPRPAPARTSAATAASRTKRIKP